jgi:ribose transport system permease protein
VTVVTMRVFLLVWELTGGSLWPSLAAVAAGLAVGGVCGLVNGLTVTRLRLTPFVATLGMFSVARGLAIWIADRTVIAFPVGARPDWVRALQKSRSETLFFDPGVWSALALAVVVAVVLRRTVFGRYCYALGSNEATARLCGINVERNKLAVYVVAGLCAGWAGLLRFARTGSGDPETGRGLELEVIAAVVIGGASLSGGQGTVAGALLGVLILALLENAVNTFGFAVEVKYVLIGVIVVANTALSQLQRRRLA